MNDIEEKRQEYTDYINEHLSNIQKAFLQFKNYENDVIRNLFISDSKLVDNVMLRVINHDKSKWSEEEFEPYRINYFPVNEEEKEHNKEAYDKAWEHHWKNNDHHWQNREHTDTLNKAACIENIIDWMAMGLKFGDTAWEYYRDNKSTIHLNELEKEYMTCILDAMEEEDLQNGYKQED